jgi:hypothetical protein
MWPAFAAVTLVDGLILHLLPPVGTGIDLIPGILIATFANLFVVGALAPWLARRTWNRRPAVEGAAPPRAQLEVLSDRIGTGLLLATVVGVLAAGLAARPVVIAETEDRERAAKDLLTHVQRQENEELRRNVEASDTDRLADGYFRTCIPHDDRESWTCFFVDVTGKRTEVTRDPSAIPNMRR